MGFRRVHGKLVSDDEGNGEIALHQAPEDVPAPVLSVLMAMLSQAYTLGKRLGVKWPIHMSVEIDGVRCCGEVFPSGWTPSATHEHSKEMH